MRKSWTGVGAKCCIVEVVDKFYYFSMKKTTSLFVNNYNKAEIVLLQNSRRVDGKLETFLDGEIVQSHPLFPAKDDTLQIIVYHDEVERCSLVGMNIKKHKVVFFLFYLWNLSPNIPF